MPKSVHALPALPPPVDLETRPVLKMLTTAHKALAELKGCATSIPNQGILIDTLSLQEAKASSEIENIVTTQDELFRAGPDPGDSQSPASKEVARYRSALMLGFDRMRATHDIISNNTLIEMFRLLKMRSGGFRATPGTKLRNQAGETIYTPPQDANEIVALMTELERFVNDDKACDLDPLIKMALIHYQFESIHPFPDGNGRIGRILNVLYLTRTGQLKIPILYLSRHITRNKSDYYRLLQEIRDTDGAPEVWEEWLLYMLTAVAETSKLTIRIIENIREQMADIKHRMREELPRVYSQDLLNTLFRYPYTRVEYVEKDLRMKRSTAARHLDALVEKGFVSKFRYGRSNYYVNDNLVGLFMDVSGE